MSVGGWLSESCWKKVEQVFVRGPHMLSALGWSLPTSRVPCSSYKVGTLFGTLDKEATASFLRGSFPLEQGRAQPHLASVREKGVRAGLLL